VLARLNAGESLSVAEQREWIDETHALNDRIVWLRKQVISLNNDLERERRRFDALVKAIKDRQGVR
jgi:hypothetical protein